MITAPSMRSTLSYRYHQDFPPKDNLSPPSSDFEETFCDYVEQMRLPPAEQDLILKAIRLHDFSSARVFLVPSVPGQHSGSALHKYGHMRLRHLLQQHLDAAPLPRAGVANPGRRGTLSSLFRNSASGASHSGQGQRDVPEGIIVQPTSIGRLNSNWFYNDFGASLCAAKSPPLKVPLRKAKPVQPKPLTPDAAYFVWPSYEGIRSSVGGWSSGGNVHATTANMEKDGKFLFPLLHHFSGEAASRAECMPHMKSFCRFKGQQLAYAIVGSHNLSIAAWGGPPRKDSQDVLMIRSYELSVLMLPVLETAYRRHRHYKFSCTPAGDLPVSRVPQPQRNGRQEQLQTVPQQQGNPQQQQHQHQHQQGQLGPRQPTQKSVQFWSLDSFINMRREAVFGSVPRPPSPDSQSSPSNASPSASRHPSQLQCPDPQDLDACAFLPLPYFLPPKPYKHNDIPWTYSAPDGVDRFGEHLRKPRPEEQG
ncbi:hypothetical protein DUNSADRAFT_18267 [Dunaliella salina]|uniref:Tyrosyl-DNA phosphodiesterase 1 n=1 Tax=Dunaliella salina TaxID=3046 RepID=A0ABQ7G0E2_DUNSA|nr:hypothetical protein DUNSADRAFT_18267 [Dunaliella salina]|eukprot:KAF5828070.1 hypothetical protein DUNSADRAFT_18267 [Dunaliella salina]